MDKRVDKLRSARKTISQEHISKGRRLAGEDFDIILSALESAVAKRHASDVTIVPAYSNAPKDQSTLYIHMDLKIHAQGEAALVDRAYEEEIVRLLSNNEHKTSVSVGDRDGVRYLWILP